MNKSEDQWSVEEIARVDAALKRMENAHEISMDMDRLFFGKDEKGAIPRLRAAGPALSRLKDDIPEDVRAKWLSMLGKQLRYSVDRAKRGAAKN